MTKLKYIADLTKETFDHRNSTAYLKNIKSGLSKELIIQISQDKKEPKWMLEHRLKCLEIFLKTPFPNWGPCLDDLNFSNIIYYASTGTKEAHNWKDVPHDIKQTFEELGIPEAEQKVLAGTGAQYESEVIYHSLKKTWQDKGILFENMDTALQKYPALVKKYFMKAVPADDHKFAALHGAVWSGGTFLYIPKGVHVDMPLQAYFRMNAPRMGQFEHTLIMLEEGSEAHYIEGCSAPKYGKRALHAGCVEIYVGENAKMRYSSVENWSKDTYNLNTKRAIIEKNGRMEWVGGNMGSGITMLYPCSVLKGEYANADHLGIAFANTGQIQDTGAKVIHLAAHTSSKIVMKSLSKGSGASVYRGLLYVDKKAHDTTSTISCDALILDPKSSSDTIPDMKINNDYVSITHEATAGKMNEDDIFYLMSRGLSEEEAHSTIVNGFIEPIIRELPLEYAVELNRLIELEMENSVG